MHLKKILMSGLALVLTGAALAAPAECVPVAAWVAPPDRTLEASFLEGIARKSVVLLGEDHESHEHHRWQLHTLAALHALRPGLVLGFEMFPRRVQGALDRWVAGELSEREFLAAAEWDKVWNMDPALYLPLFHFARMHRIPMVALDVERSERAAAVPRFAPPSEGYLGMLKEVYGKHPPSDFQRFVESQARHDRVMAQSIAEALAARPGALLMGIMGRGHVVHGYGVPHQLKDLGVREVSVLLPWDRNAECKELVAGIADAVFGIAGKEDPPRPRYGVSLDGLRIVAVEKGSVAEAAGLRAGDLLLERPLRPVPGTWVPLKVRRGTETLELIAKFPPLAAAAPAHYDMEITLDPVARTLQGRASISGAKEIRWERRLDQAAFLPGHSGWYPHEPGVLASYSVTLNVTNGDAALVPGALVSESRENGRYRARFSFPHPGRPIDLMVGPYRIEERMHKTAGGKAIRLRTYFHPEIAGLSAGYLDSVAGYLDLYEKRIGEYPFESFSVVSSPTPTGYGMPSLTYLGIEVLKLPFMRATSLGHEVLHNWWGNGVYVDYAQGNWSEGLTTFMADYAYREREGEAAAREMRLAWLRDIAAVPAGQDEPLTAFRGRTHAESQITGYRKAAMVFLMLRDALGADTFEAALRRFWGEQRFRAAAWFDLQRAFEAASGRNLEGFFSQWLTRRGAPRVQLVDAQASGSQVSVTLAQDAPPYSLNVPVVLDGKTAHLLSFSEAKKTFTFPANERPKQVALDPDLHVLRRLGPDEAPPILRGMMVAPTPGLAILSDPLREPAQALAQKLLDRRPAPQKPTLVIGIHADIDAWLAREHLPRPEEVARKGTAQAWMVRRAGPPLAVISVRDVDALAALSRPLPHYGAQSYVVFEGAKAIARGVWPSRPQTVHLAP